MTIREELDSFIERADEFIESKYILADVKIANVLKSIASSNTLVAVFKNCLTDFDYQAAQNKYFVKSQYLSSDKREFVLPPNSRELLAFVFSVLVDLDAKNVELGDFISKYFYVDGSFSSGYDLFINGMIKPFRNSVKMLMESVLDGKLQNPVEALVEEEMRRAKQRELDDIKEKKEKELLKKAYGQNIKAIKDLLLEDKRKIKASKIKEEKKNEIILIIDMLANVLESEDKDAIGYAFAAYKFLAKACKLKFIGRVKKITSLLEGVVNELG